MRETRDFAVIKLLVTSTHMPTLCNEFFQNRNGVVVRGAEAQDHENKKKDGPNWRKY